MKEHEWKNVRVGDLNDVATDWNCERCQSVVWSRYKPSSLGGFVSVFPIQDHYLVSYENVTDVLEDCDQVVCDLVINS